MIYLNNAATSYPKPGSVVKAVTNCLVQIPYEPGRGNGKKQVDILTRCRQKIAELFHIDDISRIILTSGSTAALNIVLHGLVNKRLNGHCITSTIEHNSVLRPLNHLSKSHLLKLSFVPVAKIGNLTELKKNLQKSTLFVVLSHISNVTGTILPIKEIAAWCWNQGLPLIIDASQSAGCSDINVKDLPENIILVFTGHKGLLGPMGTGGFYLGPAIELFSPLIQGGTGIRSDLLFQPGELPLYYEAGTMNLPGFAGLSEGINFIIEIGVNRIGQHKRELFRHLYERLARLDGILVYEPLNSDFPGGVLSFNITGWNPGDVGYVLHQSFGIISRTGLHCAPLIHRDIGSTPHGTVRLSCSWFTTMAEIEQTAAAITKIARSR